VLFDVFGYFTSTTSREAAGAYFAVSPERLLDTRTDFTDRLGLGPSQYVRLPIVRPGSHFKAVALNVTVTEPTSPSFLSVGPTPDATTSNLNFNAGQTVANMVVAPLNIDGTVSLLNYDGNVQLIVDILGLWDDASFDIEDGQFVSNSPARVLDTRSGIGARAGQLAADQSIELDLSGHIPPGASAVVLNVTANEPTGWGYLSVWPASRPQPNASSLNYAAGQTVPNLVMVPVSANGRVRIAAGAAGAHVIADLLGWFGAPGSGGSALHRSAITASSTAARPVFELSHEAATIVQFTEQSVV
jgi:hypothetical protein